MNKKTRAAGKKYRPRFYCFFRVFSPRSGCPGQLIASTL